MVLRTMRKYSNLLLVNSIKKTPLRTNHENGRTCRQRRTICRLIPKPPSPLVLLIVLKTMPQILGLVGCKFHKENTLADKPREHFNDLSIKNNTKNVELPHFFNS